VLFRRLALGKKTSEASRGRWGDATGGHGWGRVTVMTCGTGFQFGWAHGAATGGAVVFFGPRNCWKHLAGLVLVYGLAACGDASVGLVHGQPSDDLMRPLQP
jgi:hypothetical protein